MERREVSQEALQEAEECPRGHACLTDGDEKRPLCGVIRLLSERVAVVEMDATRDCPYETRFANAWMCICPVRCELHKRYGI